MQQYTWIYSLGQPLDTAAESRLRAGLEAFVQRWKTHGEPVRGAFDVRHGRFVLVQADPQDHRPSGCSIDSMRKAVEETLRAQDLSVLDPGILFYRDAEGAICQLHHRELKSAIETGLLHAGTPVFDHTLGQSDDLSRWEVPLSSTWMARFLKPEASKR
ncbi:MAG: hypothetical protein NW241_09185 [Bacteroidia bacterium]|nr:hypothetical protein [Bacteroidia bacterium]